MQIQPNTLHVILPDCGDYKCVELKPDGTIGNFINIARRYVPGDLYAFVWKGILHILGLTRETASIYRVNMQSACCIARYIINLLNIHKPTRVHTSNHIGINCATVGCSMMRFTQVDKNDCLYVTRGRNVAIINMDTSECILKPCPDMFDVFQYSQPTWYDPTSDTHYTIQRSLSDTGQMIITDIGGGVKCIMVPSAIYLYSNSIEKVSVFGDRLTIVRCCGPRSYSMTTGLLIDNTEFDPNRAYTCYANEHVRVSLYEQSDPSMIRAVWCNLVDGTEYTMSWCIGEDVRVEIIAAWC